MEKLSTLAMLLAAYDLAVKKKDYKVMFDIASSIEELKRYKSYSEHCP